MFRIDTNTAVPHRPYRPLMARDLHLGVNDEPPGLMEAQVETKPLGALKALGAGLEARHQLDGRETHRPYEATKGKLGTIRGKPQQRDSNGETSWPPYGSRG